MPNDADPPPGLKTPDITKTDALAFVTMLASVLSILGIADMTEAQKGALAGAIAAVYLVAQMAVDAWRRHGRAKIIAAAVMAGNDPGMVVENLPAPTPAAPAAGVTVTYSASTASTGIGAADAQTADATPPGG